MPRFAEQVEVAIEALSTNPPQAFEENEFIDASRLVYDGVRDIRKAVLMIRVCPQLRRGKSRSFVSTYFDNVGVIHVRNAKKRLQVHLQPKEDDVFTSEGESRGGV